MSAPTGTTRRDFLQSSGALVVLIASGARVAAQSAAAAPPSASTPVPPGPAPGELDSWLAIGPDGAVEAYFGKMDMGQGIEVAIAQVVAEELDVPVERVSLLMGDTERTCNQGGASGSTGVQLGARPLRHAAAEARRLLLAGAAQRLQRPLESLTLHDGVVTADGDPARSVSYAELIGGRHFEAPLEWNHAVGNGLDVKARAEPKSPADYRIVGQSVARRDVAGKVFGTADYVTDVQLPGMLHARMIRPTLPGSTVARVRRESLRDIPGAEVIQRGEFLAVLAKSEWDAVRAARALEVEWRAPAGDPFPVDAEALAQHIRQAPVVKREDPVARGDLEDAFRRAARTVSAEYYWPLQSHASMGPACAVADVHSDKATIWTGSQKPHSTRDGVAQLIGLAPERVHGKWVMGPGSYGRNDAGDAALDAAYLSKLTGKPVRVQGMRADGTAWDPKGPACVHRARAALDPAGRVIGYEFISKGLSRVNVMFNEADPRDSLAGMALGLALKAETGLGIPSESYEFPAKRLAFEVIAPLLERSSPLRTSHLRDPLGPEVHFGSEQFIDEIAAASGVDPVQFRLQHLTEPRDLAVVRAAADKAGWSARAPRNPVRERADVLRGRGIAYAQRSETVVAVIADIEVYPADGRIWARRFVVAHDCGLIVNPQSLRQTIEGNVVQGLSRTLFEEVRFDRRRVLSVDWESYPILEMRDAPEIIDVVLIDHPERPPSGAGEPTIRCVPAAVANAFFDATGVRVRSAPLSRARVREALGRT